MFPYSHKKELTELTSVNLYNYCYILQIFPEMTISKFTNKTRHFYRPALISVFEHVLGQGCGTGWILPGSGSEFREKKSDPDPTIKNDPDPDPT